jgi:hypothetical protein
MAFAFHFGMLCLGMAAFCSGSGARGTAPGSGRLSRDEDAFGPPGVRGTALGSGQLALDEAAFGNGLAFEEAAFADFGAPRCNKTFVLKHPLFKSGK